MTYAFHRTENPSTGQDLRLAHQTRNSERSLNLKSRCCSTCSPPNGAMSWFGTSFRHGARGLFAAKRPSQSFRHHQPFKTGLTVSFASHQLPSSFARSASNPPTSLACYSCASGIRLGPIQFGNWFWPLDNLLAPWKRMDIFQGDDVEELGNWLEASGLDVTSYGKGIAKSIGELLNEVNNGESVLHVHNGQPLRVVRVLNLLVRNTEGEVLVEEKQIRPDGSVRARGLPLSEKMFRGEEWQVAIHRAIAEELGTILPSNPNVTVFEDSYTKLVEMSQSQSYPGLTTRYECHRVEVRIEGLPDGCFVTTEPRPGGVLELHWAWKAL